MGSRMTGEGVEKVYDAAQLWVDCALRMDGSLFTPGEAIWTREGLGLIHDNFLDKPQPRGGDFTQRLSQQLAGSPPEVYQLMGEALYFHFLIVGTKNSRNEERRIRDALELSQLPVTMPESLVNGLTPGILRPGQHFHQRRDLQVGFLLEVAEQWKGLDADRQTQLLKDPWEFKNWVDTLSLTGALLQELVSKDIVQREALLHLTFPDTFEGIASAEHKRLIAKAFPNLIAPGTYDVDRQLQQIRTSLEKRHLSCDHFFYSVPEIRRRWHPKFKLVPSPGPIIDLKKVLKPSTVLPINTWASENIKNLAKELYWETSEIQQIIAGLEDKGQVIFQGPPGTGKTFVAKRIGELAEEHGGNYRIVQFHPSYSYEDFVEGYRPILVGGSQVGFELQDGPLKKIANDAKDNPDATYILVIDEINRTNVSKVLGELYFLLEYREDKAPLLYSKEDFDLPKNLWIIGTMNTTDRSIALVDAALRRRFYFYDFFPDESPIEGLLRRWLKKNDSENVWVADLVDRANKELQDRHLSIGPSHFMRKEKLSEDKVRFIWERAVFPYIEEQLFGKLEDIEKYKFENLKAILNRKADVPSEGSTVQGPAESGVDTE